MWPFRRQHAPITSLPDLWQVGKGERNGDFLIVRWNPGIAALRGHQDYPYQIGVAIPFLPEDGAPSHPTQDRLHEFEDLLTRRLQAGFTALLAAILTNSRMREFILYSRDPEATRCQIEQLQEETKDMVIQGIVQHDPKWRVLRALLPG